MDFAKAFDTVPHERLKAKLYRYGVCGNTLKWIDAFLCHRSQRVVINGAKSEWIHVSSGVPQGTVLGPILFNIFINDITDHIDSEIRLFADDCVCYRKIRSSDDCEVLQKDIHQLGKWAKYWNMKFEPSKCKVIHITRKTRHKICHLYFLNDTPLDTVTQIKYLGVTITNDLRWNYHVAEITKKANQILGLLRRNLSACDSSVKEAAYIGLVRPLLEYASSAWDPYTDQLINEIEKVQRRAARFVLSDYNNYEPGSITGMFEKLGWKSLQQRRRIDRLNLFNKALNNFALLQFTEIVKKPSRTTRSMHSKHLITISTRTNVYKFSFLPRTIVDWNNLSKEVIEYSNNIDLFHNHLISTM